MTVLEIHWKVHASEIHISVCIHYTTYENTMQFHVYENASHLYPHAYTVLEIRRRRPFTRNAILSYPEYKSKQIHLDAYSINAYSLIYRFN